ncbi:ornithine cyclodeaminase [Marinithermofilum abyssi]|uniref:Ornithine cyclodeaminase n=1 Tax=Marinithermofilum abyssi TaxID=1571185 RepID=A0A8J2VGT1_9BACL|nr:ornithine cyclodeaminase family protein [Marinithermofilum abyssi]GGE11553.1 ornithine cyclodeaminase [Marinithermofilum abyssi]
MLFIDAKRVRRLFQMAEGIRIIEETIRHWAEERAKAPPRTSIPVPEEDAAFLFMPAYLGDSRYAAVKVASVFPDNPRHGRPSIQSVTLLSDGKTGEHLAVIDSAWLTVMRTGALSGVAAKYLARKDASVLGVIGCGAQSTGQIAAIMVVRPIRKVMLYNRSPEKARRLSEKLQKEYPSLEEVRVMENPDETASLSDILVCSTTSATPVFDGHLLRPGTHVSAIGSYRPNMQEVDSVTLEKSDRIFADTLAGVMEEAGDFLIPMKEGRFFRDWIEGELKDLVLGTSPGRRSEKEITLFKSVGFSLPDAALAQLIYEKTKQSEKNTRIDGPCRTE